MCKYYCNWHSDFVEHIKTHQDDNEDVTYWCQVCMKVIFGIKMLIAHLKSYNHTELVTVINRSVPVVVRSISMVQCQKCDLKFRFNLSLKKHMQLTHGEVNFELENHVKYRCNYCSYYSYKKSALKSHLFLVHPNPKLKYDCYLCKQQFSSKESAESHRNTATHRQNSQLHKMLEEKTNCHLCPDEFLCYEDLTCHLETQHILDSPQCHLCGAIFHFQQELTLHINTKCKTGSKVENHDGIANFKCTHCSLKFIRESLLNLHKSCSHSHLVDSSFCQICQVSFTKVQENEHQHSDELKLCPTCNKQFESKIRYEKHLSSCRAEYKCKLCNYSSSKKILLNLHVKRQHKHVSSPQMFQCEFCNSQYSLKSSLNMHVKSQHQTNRKLKCKICDFECHFKSDLQRHEIKHSSSKTLRCPKCNFLCKRKNELVRHEKYVHANQDLPVLQCNLCHYQTKNSDHFKRHMKSKHQTGEYTYFEINLNEDDFVIAKTSDISVPEFVTEQIVINE